MSTKYDYNKLCDPSRLTKEIEDSDIITALDYISTSSSPVNTDIWFKAELSSGDEDLLDTLVTNHINTPLPDNVAKDIRIVEDTVTPRDSDSVPLNRTKITQTGWTLYYQGLEMTTSNLSGVSDKKSNGVDNWGYSTIKLYDSQDAEITDQQNISNCVKTVVDWEPHYDYDIVGGVVYQQSSSETDIIVGVVGVPDVPENYGGSKTFAAGINLKYIDKQFEIDGKIPKYLTYNSELHTNKIRFIFKHNAGVQHTILCILNLFKA